MTVRTSIGDLAKWIRPWELGKSIKAKLDDHDSSLTLLEAQNTSPLLWVYNVMAFGAKGDGSTVDRAAAQNTIDLCAAAGGGGVYFPRGVYMLDKGTGAGCLFVPSTVQLLGDGEANTILKQVAGIADGVRIIVPTGDGVIVSDMTLDGNKAAQTVGTGQRHGVFVQNAKKVKIYNVTAQNFTGDGFAFFDGSDQARMAHCTATLNLRNGITLNGNADDYSFDNVKLLGNAAQQLDSEPGGSSVVSNVKVVNATIDGLGIGTDYAVTCSGASGSVPGRGWSIIGSTINGGIKVVFCNDVTIAHNVSNNPTGRGFVEVQNNCENVAIAHNVIRMTQSTTDQIAAILVIGTGTGAAPIGVVIEGNRIRVDNRAKSYGIKAWGCIDVQIVNNRLRGPGLAAVGGFGIYLRATNTAEAFRTALVRGNKISNWGEVGIAVLGSSTAQLLHADLSHNDLDDDAGVMVKGISFDYDGLHAVQAATMIGNTPLGGVTTPVHTYPNVPVLIGGTRSAGGIYSVSASPAGSLVEAVGAFAISRADGSRYAKTSGGGSSSGWVGA